MILISVRSKYGSCSGNCTGLMNINNTPPPLFIYNILLYMCLKSLYSSKVERNTVNILVECSTHSKGFPYCWCMVLNNKFIILYHFFINNNVFYIINVTSDYKYICIYLCIKMSIINYNNCYILYIICRRLKVSHKFLVFIDECSIHSDINPFI